MLVPSVLANFRGAQLLKLEINTDLSRDDNSESVTLNAPVGAQY